MKWLDLILKNWETITLIITTFGGWAWGVIQRKWKLPKQAIWVIEQLKKCNVSLDSMYAFITTVDAMGDKTNDEKFQIVSDWLRNAAKCAGVELSDNVCDLIVQWAYSTWKARQKK